MASLKSVARLLREDAENGIAWIVLWKNGRSWKWDTVYPDEDRGGNVTMEFDGELDTLRDALAEDPNAIIVNGYCHNLGVVEGFVTAEDLAVMLRWQYGVQKFRLADFMERIVQPA